MSDKDAPQGAPKAESSAGQVPAEIVKDALQGEVLKGRLFKANGIRRR